MPRSARPRALLLLLFTLLALPAAPQQAGTTTARERELAQIRAEISRLEARLSAARRRQTGLQGELAATEIDLQLQGKRLAEAAAARDLAARRQGESAREVARLEEAVAASRAALSRRLSGLYRLGRQGYFRLFLSLKPDERLLPSIRLVRFLARRDRQAIDEHGAAKARLAAERDRLAAERAELEGWIGREEGRRRALVAARSRQAALLARAESEGRALSAQASALEEKERKLSAFVDLLYGRSGALSGKPIQQFRGVLDWPAAGRVTAGFGPRLDPRYRTRVPHNGVDLATEAGGEVRSVFPGKVLFAAPFSGYGWTVVVHHPGRVLSLYAGLSELKAGAGDMVSLGQVVGLASESLYFEIRVENRPENPLAWLRSP